MNHLRSIFVLLILLLTFLGGSIGIFSSGVLDYHRSSFQQFVKNSEDNLEKITFTKKEFMLIHWEEAGEEFEWQGKMFDVSRIVPTPDGFVIFCIHDDLEDTILDFFKVNAPKTDMPVSKGKIQPMHFYHLFQYEVPECPDQTAAQPSNDPWNVPLQREIPSPPPRTIYPS